MMPTAPLPKVTGHASHFLSRVDRLGSAHAELALALYRAPELVKYALQASDLAVRGAQVAISLSSAEAGPFIIVTPEGRFVTCLGAGMKPSAKDPILSFGSLKKLGEEFSALREVMSRAGENGKKQFRSLMHRLSTAGPVISQETFDELLAWQPLLGRDYCISLIEAGMDMEESYLALRSAKRIGQRHEPALRQFWESVWAMGHLTTLIGAQPEHFEAFLTEMDGSKGQADDTRQEFILSQFGAQQLPFIARGAWLAGRMPKTFHQALKHGFAEEAANTQVGCALGLASIGLRHKRYFSEVQKLFQRAARGSSDTEETSLHALVGEALDACLTTSAEVDDSLLFEQAGESLLDGLGPLARGGVVNFSPEQALAALLLRPASLLESPETLGRFVLWLPLFSRFDARDFYLPAAQLAPFASSYSPEAAFALFESKSSLEPAQQPYVAPAIPGRNDPCSCGSGKKYKRCCGRAG